MILSLSLGLRRDNLSPTEIISVLRRETIAARTPQAARPSGCCCNRANAARGVGLRPMACHGLAIRNAQVISHLRWLQMWATINGHCGERKISRFRAKRANVTMAVAFLKGCRAPSGLRGRPPCPCCPVRAPLQIRPQRCARPCRDDADRLVQRGSGQEFSRHMPDGATGRSPSARRYARRDRWSDPRYPEDLWSGRRARQQRCFRPTAHGCSPKTIRSCRRSSTN